MSHVSDQVIIGDAIRLVGEGMQVTFPVKGWSMLPFIVGGKERVDLVRPEHPQVGDVVLASVCLTPVDALTARPADAPRRYVVHRIVSIEGDLVTLMGDGNIRGCEYCRREDIAAVATHVVDRHGRHHDLQAPWRQKAYRLWRRLLPVRRWLLAIYRRTILKL